jgi:hypothetical protein
MRRYHRAVYTEPGHWQRLEAFTKELNCLNWTYSGHCLDNVKSRAIDLEGILRFIKGLTLEAGQIFEYYLADKTDEPIKVCYRIDFPGAGQDIILVMGDDKEIITIYINSKDDKHYTLKKELYISGEAGK